ncbi:hypothetical protein K438DRAFT_1858601 [Mycena galopus ATCC 62051]|nr:hypothetical protein K438DRAFT_1858601 [Mycena galopus ATCC 62051]
MVKMGPVAGDGSSHVRGSSDADKDDQGYPENASNATWTGRMKGMPRVWRSNLLPGTRGIMAVSMMSSYGTLQRNAESLQLARTCIANAANLAIAATGMSIPILCEKVALATTLPSCKLLWFISAAFSLTSSWLHYLALPAKRRPRQQQCVYPGPMQLIAFELHSGIVRFYTRACAAVGQIPVMSHLALLFFGLGNVAAAAAHSREFAADVYVDLHLGGALAAQVFLGAGAVERGLEGQGVRDGDSALGVGCEFWGGRFVGLLDTSRWACSSCRIVTCGVVYMTVGLADACTMYNTAGLGRC